MGFCYIMYGGPEVQNLLFTPPHPLKKAYMTCTPSGDHDSLPAIGWSCVHINQADSI